MVLVVAVLVKNQATVNKLVELVCLLTSQVLLYSVVEAVVPTLELVDKVVEETVERMVLRLLVLLTLVEAVVVQVILMLLVVADDLAVLVVLALSFFVFLIPSLQRSLV